MKFKNMVNESFQNVSINGVLYSLNTDEKRIYTKAKEAEGGKLMKDDLSEYDKRIANDLVTRGLLKRRKNPQHKIYFMTKGRRKNALDNTIQQNTPPDKDLEKWIADNEEKYKEKYGKEYKSKLMAKAWNKFNGKKPLNEGWHYEIDVDDIVYDLSNSTTFTLNFDETDEDEIDLGSAVSDEINDWASAPIYDYSWNVTNKWSDEEQDEEDEEVWDGEDDDEENTQKSQINETENVDIRPQFIRDMEEEITHVGDFWKNIYNHNEYEVTEIKKLIGTYGGYSIKQPMYVLRSVKNPIETPSELTRYVLERDYVPVEHEDWDGEDDEEIEENYEPIENYPESVKKATEEVSKVGDEWHNIYNEKDYKVIRIQQQECVFVDDENEFHKYLAPMYVLKNITDDEEINERLVSGEILKRDYRLNKTEDDWDGEDLDESYSMAARENEFRDKLFQYILDNCPEFRATFKSMTHYNLEANYQKALSNQCLDWAEEIISEYSFTIPEPNNNEYYADIDGYYVDLSELRNDWEKQIRKRIKKDLPDDTGDEKFWDGDEQLNETVYKSHYRKGQMLRNVNTGDLSTIKHIIFNDGHKEFIYEIETKKTFSDGEEYNLEEMVSEQHIDDNYIPVKDEDEEFWDGEDLEESVSDDLYSHNEYNEGDILIPNEKATALKDSKKEFKIKYKMVDADTGDDSFILSWVDGVNGMDEHEVGPFVKEVLDTYFTNIGPKEEEYWDGEDDDEEINETLRIAGVQLNESEQSKNLAKDLYEVVVDSKEFLDEWKENKGTEEGFEDALKDMCEEWAGDILDGNFTLDRCYQDVTWLRLGRLIINMDDIYQDWSAFVNEDSTSDNYIKEPVWDGEDDDEPLTEARHFDIHVNNVVYDYDLPESMNLEILMDDDYDEADLENEIQKKVEEEASFAINDYDYEVVDEFDYNPRMVGPNDEPEWDGEDELNEVFKNAGVQLNETKMVKVRVNNISYDTETPEEFDTELTLPYSCDSEREIRDAILYHIEDSYGFHPREFDYIIRNQWTDEDEYNRDDDDDYHRNHNYIEDEDNNENEDNNEDENMWDGEDLEESVNGNNRLSVTDYNYLLGRIPDTFGWRDRMYDNWGADVSNDSDSREKMLKQYLERIMGKLGSYIVKEKNPNHDSYFNLPSGALFDYIEFLNDFDKAELESPEGEWDGDDELDESISRNNAPKYNVGDIFEPKEKVGDKDNPFKSEGNLFEIEEVLDLRSLYDYVIKVANSDSEDRWKFSEEVLDVFFNNVDGGYWDGEDDDEELMETKPARLKHHTLEPDAQFAHISAERNNPLYEPVEGETKKIGKYKRTKREKQKAENNRNTERLKQDIKDLGLSYIKTYGAWHENDKTTNEKSFIVPNISKEDAMKLGKKYGQYSIIFKPSGKDVGSMYVTLDDDNYGMEDMQFIFNKEDGLEDVDSSIPLTNYSGYSGLKKNGHGYSFKYKEPKKDED